MRQGIVQMMILIVSELEDYPIRLIAQILHHATSGYSAT
jgi:hypothetical protein